MNYCVWKTILGGGLGLGGVSDRPLGVGLRMTLISAGAARRRRDPVSSSSGLQTAVLIGKHPSVLPHVQAGGIPPPPGEVLEILFSRFAAKMQVGFLICWRGGRKRRQAL